MIDEVKVEVRKEGKEEAVLGSESKVNLQVIDFPIFRIENAFVKLEEATKSITVTFEESFLHAPIVQVPGIDTPRSYVWSRERFKVTYERYISGYLAYTAIGMTADVRKWSFEEEKESLVKDIESLRKDIDMKIGGAGVGGAIGGVAIEEIIKRL